MRKLTTILTSLLLLMALRGQAQVVLPPPTARVGVGQSIDPARLYLQRMQQQEEREEEELDPLTKRRRQMRAFVPQGNWFCGVGLGYLTMNSGHTDLVFSGMEQADMRLNGFSLQPYVGYAVASNCIIGLRAGYSETHGQKPFFTEYEGDTPLHTYLDVDYTHQIYNLEAFWRGYIPIDSRLRWAAFLDVTLGYRGGSGHVLSDRDDEAFRSNFSLNQIRLGLQPGIALALTNNVSLDLSVGLANLSYAFQHEKNRAGEDIRSEEFRVNSLIDIASFQGGITINY